MLWVAAQAGRVFGCRRHLGFAEVPSAPVDPSRLPLTPPHHPTSRLLTGLPPALNSLACQPPRHHRRSSLPPDATAPPPVPLTNGFQRLLVRAQLAALDARAEKCTNKHVRGGCAALLQRSLHTPSGRGRKSRNRRPLCGDGRGRATATMLVIARGVSAWPVLLSRSKWRRVCRAERCQEQALGAVGF